MSRPSFDFAAFRRGLGLPFAGARFLLNHHGLKRYAALPLIANIFLYGLAFMVYLYFLWRWQIYEVHWVFLGPVGRWLSALVNSMGWLMKFIMSVLALAAAFFTFTGVGMALASPLNDMLSEKVEVACMGGVVKEGMPLRFTAKAGLLSFGDSLKNLLRQLCFTLLVLPFLLVPLLGFIPLFLVGAYFAAFGFLDASMARNFLRYRHKRLFVNKRFWEFLGFGVAMQAMFLIPFVGMLLMPVGVVAGTLLYCSEDWERLLAEGRVAPPAGFVPPGGREPTKS